MIHIHIASVHSQRLGSHSSCAPGFVGVSRAGWSVGTPSSHCKLLGSLGTFQCLGETRAGFASGRLERTTNFRLSARVAIRVEQRRCTRIRRRARVLKPRPAHRQRLPAARPCQLAATGRIRRGRPSCPAVLNPPAWLGMPAMGRSRSWAVRALSTGGGESSIPLPAAGVRRSRQLDGLCGCADRRRRSSDLVDGTTRRAWAAAPAPARALWAGVLRALGAAAAAPAPAWALGDLLQAQWRQHADRGHIGRAFAAGGRRSTVL